MAKITNVNRAICIGPLAVTLITIIFAVAVSPHTSYGDAWAVYPVVIAYLSILVWHVLLIIKPICFSRLLSVIYALSHLGAGFGVYIFALMKISKDSL